MNDPKKTIKALRRRLKYWRETAADYQRWAKEKTEENHELQRRMGELNNGIVAAKLAAKREMTFTQINAEAFTAARELLRSLGQGAAADLMNDGRTARLAQRAQQ